MSNRDKRFLALAARVATKSSCPYRHGAVVVKSGRVLGQGTNYYRNSPKIFPVNHFDTANDISVHAEVAALRRVKNPRGCTVYVARVRPKGGVGLSKPCSSCHAYLQKLQVKVVYTTDED